MLVELGLVEQRYQAVLEVLNDGALVTDVAGVTGGAPDGACVAAELRDRERTSLVTRRPRRWRRFCAHSGSRR